jgi:hypothetical protein
VTEEENEQLTKPFSMEEIKTSVISIEKNMAPGPDHILIEFYQSGWDIIENDLCEMLSEFWEHKLDVGRLNYSVITLIKTLKEANKIK